MPESTHPIDHEAMDHLHQESIDLFVAAWQTLARGFAQATIEDRDGLSLVWPDVALPFYNAVFVKAAANSEAELKAQTDKAAAYAATRSHAGLIALAHDLLSPEALASAPALLHQHGYALAMPVTGMVAEDALAVVSDVDPKLRIERDQDGAALTEVNCRAYDVPTELGSASVPERRFWQSAFPYLVYEGDRAVSTATVLVVKDCLYVALVATLPEARGHGYARAAMSRALRAAHEATGIRRTLLHATDAGLPLYQSMGYQGIGRIDCYMPAGH